MKTSSPHLIWSFVSIIVLILSAGWIWISRIPDTQMQDLHLFVPQKGFQAPDFTLSGIQGEPFTLSEFKGQSVLVNFWASWCPPCRAEMPAMERVYQDYASRGFEILAINASNQDNLENVNNFFIEYGLSFPILFDQDGKIQKLYQVSALPTSFFIDSQGIVHEVVVGGPMSEALLRSRVEELLTP